MLIYSSGDELKMNIWNLKLFVIAGEHTSNYS